MKRLLLLFTLLVPTMLFGQSYDVLWKQVEKADQDDLPQTEQQVLKKIISKAGKEKAYGHLLKAELKQMQAVCEVSSDSLKPAVERLEERVDGMKDEALKAVYQTVLGLIYEQNSSAFDNSQKKAEQYFDQAMANPAMLASVKVNSYVPFVEKGVDSQIYDNDLLSLLGTETSHYDVMRRYYEQSGNRPAAMLSSLNWLRNQEPSGKEKLEESRYIMRLDSLLEQYGDLQEACEVAMERYGYMTNHTTATNQQRWDFLEMALKRWGKWMRADYLRYDKEQLLYVKFQAFLDMMVNTPSATNKVVLKEMRGITKMTMRVYRVDATAYELRNLYVENDKDFKKIKSKLNALPELTQERTYTGNAPYDLFTDTLTLQALPVGVYLLEFESSPNTERKVHMLYYVSGLRMLSLRLPGEKVRYVVVDADSGQPVKDAQIRLSKDKLTTTLTTDAKGECIYDTNGKYISEIFVNTEKDKACPALSSSGYFSYYNNDRVIYQAKIFTDRAIYRPGQTVYVSAILYKAENGFKNSVCKGEKLTVTLNDANNKEVDSKEVTTDDFGTCATQFTLPRKGLAGRYRIEVDGEQCGAIYNFRVEEYKRPTFEVEIPQVKDSYADGDTLQVKGMARSYAGVPVQDGKVKYKVERRRSYWWWGYSRYWDQGVIAKETEDNILAEGEVETDGDGSFTVPTPIVVPKTHYTMFYNFVVTVEVTDQAGETHHGELSLPLGNKKTALGVELSEKVRVDNEEGFTFHLCNAAGTDLDAEVQYRYTPEGKRSQKWLTAKTNKKIQLPKLKSGRYQLEAICGNDTLKQDFIVFSLDDKTPAAKTDEWFYVSHARFPNDGSPVTVQVGSSDENVHMAYAVFAGKTIVESGTIDQSNALWNRKITYKEEYGNGLTLSFAWIKNGKLHSYECHINRPVPDSKLHLKWETFRDRLVPGQQEEWTLSVMGPDGKPVNAQIMATLYDKSLDQLTNHDWSLSSYLWLPLPSAHWNSMTWGSRTGFGMVKVPTPTLRGFQFNAFDRSVFPVYVRSYGRLGSTRRLRGSSVLNEVVLKVNEKVVDMEESSAMASADQALQGRIAGLDVVANKRSLGNGIHLAGTEETPSEEMAVQVRENLNETAFFYPQLYADSEGRVTVKFTLPESLTTWRFMGLAHTQDMKTGFIDGEAVAKKDVMIMPNVPRFVRLGDKATISARIFNSGEKMISGKARMLLLDPETDEVVFSKEQQVSVAKDSTLAVTFDYDTKDETRNLLVLKMMVSGEDFSDGEQHYLPILPNQERVTKTVPFTQIEPGTKTISLSNLKPQTSNLQSQITIEYTNNPAWLMIQALPTVGHPHDKCAICQASSYYANAIGRFILKQNPQAKNVFEAWSRDEVSLQSSLQKNQELKDLLLDETPWVADANREQEQKERLSDFFDANLMQQRLNSTLEQMKTLQNGDGSWSWWPGMDGSLYMTVEICEMLVRLNQMTGKQSETSTMLDKSFGYIGKEMVKMVNEMKKAEKKGIKQTFPSHKALQWLYICTLDGRKLLADVQSANTYLINLLKKETKNQSIYDKAMSAIVLNNKTYIKSLKEYTVYREEMGRYYDTRKALYSWRDYRIPTQVAAIEAIKRLTPDDTQTIEEMQRWLLQEKRNQAWDTPISSADAVYAFLNGNSESLKSQEKTVLKVDGKEIETSQATAGIGYVKTTMTGDDKQTFTAEKTSTGTSWGAVYMQYMQPTSDIESQNSGIKVKREILTSASNLKPQTSNFKVGDKVKVRITIEADRDYDFVQVVDKRAACMEPVNQLSGYRWGYYTSPKDCSTNYYFDRLSKGKHVIETEYYIDRIGTYETGTCTASCAYSPEFRGVAKSQTIEVR